MAGLQGKIKILNKFKVTQNEVTCKAQMLHDKRLGDLRNKHLGDLMGNVIKILIQLRNQKINSVVQF